MSERSTGPLTFFPEQLIFQDVRLHETYPGVVSIRNNLDAAVEIALRPGSVERYVVCPDHLHIKAGELSNVEIRLKVLRYAHTKKASTQGQKDIFHIKSKFFDQKYYCTFFMKDDNGLSDFLSPLKANLRSKSEKTQANIDAGAVPPIVLNSKDTSTSMVKSGMREKNDVLENAVRREKEEQEARNEKVLMLLKAKDLDVSRLTSENKELKDRFRALQQQLTFASIESYQSKDVEPVVEISHKSVQTQSHISPQLTLQADQDDSPQSHGDVEEELYHAKQQIQELQDLLDKQRDTFASECKRLLGYRETNSHGGQLCSERDEVDEARCCEEEFENKLTSLKERGFHPHNTNESGCEHDMLKELAVRDAKILELTAYAERQNFEIMSLRQLDSQLTEQKRLSVLAKKAAVRTEEELNAAVDAIAEHKQAKHEAEKRAEELKKLLESCQTRLCQIETSEQILQESINKAKEEKIEAAHQEKQNRENLELRIKRLQENLKALQQPQSTAQCQAIVQTDCVDKERYLEKKILQLQEKCTSQESTISHLKDELSKSRVAVAEWETRGKTLFRSCSCAKRLNLMEIREDDTNVLSALKPENCETHKSTGDLMEIAGPRVEHAMELQRNLTIAEERLKVLRTDNEQLKLETAKLRQELVESSRESSEMHSRLLEMEDGMTARTEAVVKKQMTISNSQSNELSTLHRQLKETELAIDSAFNEKKIVEGSLADAKNAIEKLKTEMTSFKAQMESDKTKWKEVNHCLTNDLIQMRKQLQISSSDLEAAKLKNKILLETLETLQVGDLCEKDQMIVSLNAQLLQLQSLQASKESRIFTMQEEYEKQRTQICGLESEIEALTKLKAKHESQLQHRESQYQSLEHEFKKIRLVLKQQNELNIRLSEELDQVSYHIRIMETEREAAEEALVASQNRHLKEIEMERDKLLRESTAVETEYLFPMKDNDSTETQDVSTKVEEILNILKRSCYISKGLNQACQPLQEEALMLFSVLEKYKTLVLEANSFRSKTETDLRLAERKAETWMHRAKNLEAALERRTVEWQLNESRTKALYVALNGQTHTNVIYIRQRYKSQAVQMEVLWEERKKLSSLLDETNTKLMTVKKAIVDSEQQNSNMKLQLQQIEIENKELRASLHDQNKTGDNWENFVEGTSHEDSGDGSIKTYFETEITKLMLNTDPKEKLLGLTRQVCALKLTESQLSTALATAQRRNDSLELSCAQLRTTLRQQNYLTPHTNLFSKTEYHDGNRAYTNKEVAKKSEELYLLKQNIDELSQSLALKQSEINSLNCKITELETALEGARGSSEEAICIKSREFQACLDRQESMFDKKLKACKQNESTVLQKFEILRNSHEEELSNLKVAYEKAVEDAVNQAVDNLPTQTQLDQAEVAAEVARDDVTRLETEVVDTRQENMVLHNELSRTKLKVLELEAKAETTATAVSSLENTLEQIDKNCQRNLNSGRGVNQKQRKGASISGKESTSVGGLARQLTQAKLAEADAQRRIRVAARVEIELRQMLSERDARISDLKVVLSSRTKAHDSIKRQLDVLTRRHGTSNLHKIASLRQPGICISKNDNKDEQERSPQAKDLARLKIELAKKEADILYLRGELAEVKASHLDNSLCTDKHDKTEKLQEEKDSVRFKHYEMLIAVKETATAIRQLNSLSDCYECEVICKVETQSDAVASLKTIVESYKVLMSYLKALKSQSSLNALKASTISLETDNTNTSATNEIDGSSSDATSDIKTDIAQLNLSRRSLLSQFEHIVSTLSSIDLVIKSQKKGRPPSDIAWKDLSRRILTATSKTTQLISELRSSLLFGKCSEYSCESSLSLRQTETDQTSAGLSVKDKSELQINLAEPRHSVGCQTDKASVLPLEMKSLVTALRTKSSKWKQRCRSLGSVLMKLKTVAAARESLLKEKICSLENIHSDVQNTDRTPTQNVNGESSNASFQMHSDREELNLKENSSQDKDSYLTKVQLLEALRIKDELSNQLDCQTKQISVQESNFKELKNKCERQRTIIVGILSRLDWFEEKLNSFSALAFFQKEETRTLVVDREPYALLVGSVNISELHRYTNAATEHLQKLKDELHGVFGKRRTGWKRALVTVRLKAAVSEFKQSMLQEMKVMQGDKSKLLVDIETLKSEKSKVDLEKAELLRLEKASSKNKQDAFEKNIADIEELQIRHHAEKEALWKEATKQIEETKAQLDFSIREDAKQQLSLEYAAKEMTLRNAYNTLDLEHKNLMESFEKFKKAKSKEISTLESRLRSILNSKLTSKNRARRKQFSQRDSENEEISTDNTCYDRLGLSCEERSCFWKILSDDNDGTWTPEEKLVVLSRELEFEHLEKQRLVETLSVKHSQEKECREQVRMLKKENKQQKSMIESHTIVLAEKIALKSECDKLKEELASVKEELRCTKIESNSRQRALTAIQNGSSSDKCATIAVALEAEKQTRIIVEEKLSSARNTICRKDTIITELRRKIEEVEDTVRVAILEDVQNNQDRLKSQLHKLAQSADRKDSTIAELNQRLKSASTEEQTLQKLLEDERKRTADLKMELVSVVERLNCQKSQSRDYYLSVELAKAHKVMVQLIEDIIFFLLQSSIKQKAVVEKSDSCPNANAIADIVDLSCSEVEDLLNLQLNQPTMDSRPVIEVLASEIKSLFCKLQEILKGEGERDETMQMSKKIEDIATSILELTKTHIAPIFGATAEESESKLNLSC